jgi:hypothetical protein
MEKSVTQIVVNRQQFRKTFILAQNPLKIVDIKFKPDISLNFKFHQASPVGPDGYRFEDQNEEDKKYQETDKTFLSLRDDHAHGDIKLQIEVCVPSS